VAEEVVIQDLAVALLSITPRTSSPSANFFWYSGDSKRGMGGNSDSESSELFVAAIVSACFAEPARDYQDKITTREQA
jgi:hypothetical protein